MPDAFRVLLGDFLDVSREMEHGASLVLADPPYSSGGMFRGDRMIDTASKYQQSDVVTRHAGFPGDNRDQRSWLLWSALWLGECLKLSAPGALLCVFTDWRQLPQTTDAVQCGGWVYRGIVPWNKVVARPTADRFRAQCEYIVWGTNGARDQEPGPGSVYLPGFFEVRTVPTADREHATEKPLELLRQIVRLCPEGGLVLDPFCGSGSTGEAAVSMGRRFVGSEIDEHWAGVARKNIGDAASHFWTDPEPQETQREMFSA
jgi:site-specific DNA-methyltransferase (adenine-specific)